MISRLNAPMFTAKMILHRDTRNNFITVIKKKKKIRFSSPPLIFALSWKNVGRQTKPTDKQNFPISSSRFRTRSSREIENERDCFPFFVPARQKRGQEREREHTCPEL